MAYDGTSGELTEAADQLAGLLAAAERQFLGVIAAIGSSGAYKEDGAFSLADWLVERYRCSRERANALVAVARVVAALPGLASAYESGEVSFCQLRAVSPVATPENDAALAAELPGLSAAQARELARRLRPVKARDREAVHRRRHLRLVRRDESVRLEGELTIEDATVVEEALERLAAAPERDPATGEYTAYDQAMADALVEMSSQSLGEAQHDAPADVAAVSVIVEGDSLVGDATEAYVGEHHDPVTHETARRLLCDAKLQVFSVNEKGEVVGLGRASRVVPHWMRVALHLRDGGCRFPGCRYRRWVDRHHITHWADGGTTDAANCLEICRRHHVFVHEHHWRIEGDPSGEVRFVSPEGRVASSRPEPVRRRVLERFGLVAPDDDDDDDDDWEPGTAPPRPPGEPPDEPPGEPPDPVPVC